MTENVFPQNIELHLKSFIMKLTNLKVMQEDESETLS